MPTTPVTVAQLKIVFPDAAADLLQQVANEMNLNPAGLGLDTNLRRAHFLAQARQESGSDIGDLSENLNYSPTALMKFGYYKNHPAEATTDGYDKDPATGKIRRKANVQAIANKAYGRDELGNGGPQTGDGWRYRGRGMIQVTGKSNYAAISTQCKLLYPGMDVDFVANPDRMAELPGAVRSAVGFWMMHKLHLLADKGDTGAHVDAITAVVNKNTDSYAARRANFVLARRAFP